MSTITRKDVMLWSGAGMVTAITTFFIGCTSSSPVTHVLRINTDGVGTVTVSPLKAEYENGAEVTLTATPGADYKFVSWNLDTPGIDTTETDNPLTLTMIDTVTATATFTTIKTATPTFSPAAGTFTDSTSVTLDCDTGGAIIYYTTNGTTPSITSTIYTDAIVLTSTTTIKAFARISGKDDSKVASATYTIQAAKVATPTIDPTETEVTGTARVTLACATADATIYYTIDGTTPDPATATEYTDAFYCFATTTVKAIAVKSGLTNSDVLTHTYTITY